MTLSKTRKKKGKESERLMCPAEPLATLYVGSGLKGGILKRKSTSQRLAKPDHMF